MSERLTVSVRGIVARGHHGVFPGERARGQRFVVDLDMLVETEAAHSDLLDDTVDYGIVSSAVARIVEGEPVELIERLAGLIADEVLNDSRVLEVVVTVHKPEVELSVVAAEAAVTLRRTR